MIKGCAADKEATTMSFSVFCQTWLIKLLIQKYTICQDHLLPCSTQKKLFPSSSPKRKGRSEGFNICLLLHRSHCAPLTPAQVKKRFMPQSGEGEPGRGGQGPACQAPPQGEPPTSHSPQPSHPLIPALMDIKNRTKQGWRWEQNPCTTGLDRCSHSAVKCKNKKGQPSCLPQDASRFFNIVVPPHISLWMLHYIYMSLKYLPFS